MVFLSLGLRLRAEAEALNMVENVGNYNRHRAIPAIKHLDDGYEIVLVPAVSGQHLANAYMRALAGLAINIEEKNKGKKLLCDMCRDYKIIGGFPKRPNETSNEEQRVKDCIVEDITGFMVAKVKEEGEEKGGKGNTKEKKVKEEGEEKGGKGNTKEKSKGFSIKRTSRIMFSYLVPDIDSFKSNIPLSFPQFHVRFNQKEQADQQAIFYKENASPIYMSLINIDVDGVGKYVDDQGEIKEITCNSGNCETLDRIERIKLSLDALKVMFDSLTIGANKSRNTPLIEPIGGILAISNPINFVVSPPRMKIKDKNLSSWYIEDTITRAKNYCKNLNEYKIEEIINIMYFDKENNYDYKNNNPNDSQICTNSDDKKDDKKDEISQKNSFEDLIDDAKKKIMELISNKK
jgi:CRISPR-associated protein Csa2